MQRATLCRLQIHVIRITDSRIHAQTIKNTNFINVFDKNSIPVLTESTAATIPMADELTKIATPLLAEMTKAIVPSIQKYTEKLRRYN